jgi:hypothetical protein
MNIIEKLLKEKSILDKKIEKEKKNINKYVSYNNSHKYKKILLAEQIKIMQQYADILIERIEEERKIEG